MQTDAPEPYHIFNIANNGGFVIVSGDDRTRTVLGYADQGYIDPNRMPEGLLDLLGGYAEEITALADEPQALPAEAPARAVQFLRRPILPLIQTMWGQGDGFNLYTPIIQTSGGTEHALTGCIATSLAQLAYYHRWPNSTTKTIPGYFNRDMNQQLDSLPVTSFDYDAMLLRYDDNSDSAAMRAVSKLMQYCGWAMQMEYAPGGSSAYSIQIPQLFVPYFDYDSSTVFAERVNYSYQEWIDLLYNELANNRPMAYAGQRTTTGHSFICDGYDADDYFHFNFGWSGGANGYYCLSALNPFSTGTTTPRYADGGYCLQQGALIGLKPNSGEAPKYAPVKLMDFCFYNDSSKTKVYQRDSIEQNFTGINIGFRVSTQLIDTADFEYFAKMIDNQTGEVVDTLIWKVNNPDQLPPYTNRRWRVRCNMGANLVRGSYLVRFQARLSGTEEWKDAQYNDVHYLSAEIDSLTLTLTAQQAENVLPGLLDITSNGPHTIDQMDTVTVRLVAQDGDFRTDRLYLYRLRDDHFHLLAGQQAFIALGDTATYRFMYKPSQAGRDTLLVTASEYFINPLDTLMPAYCTVDILDNPEKPIDYTQTLECDLQITNLQNNILYGNAIHSVVSVVNHSPDSAMKAYFFLDFLRWKRNNAGNWNRTRITSYRKDATIPKQTGQVPDTALININANGLFSRPDTTAFYSFQLFYYKYINGEWVEVEVDHIGFENGHGVLQVLGGYALGDATANRTLRPQSDTVRCEDACFLDMRTMDMTGVVIIPSTNPNCIYRINPNAPVPAELAGLNIAIGNNADSIIIHDGHDFFCPIKNLSAHLVRYSRQVNVSLPNHTVWNTLMLPFKPTSIDTDLRIYSPDYDEPCIIHLLETDSIEPYSPYFFKLTGDGTTGLVRNITFSATDCQMTTTPNNVQWVGELYTVNATNRLQEVEDAMTFRALNIFDIQAPMTTIEPFSVWITGNTIFANTTGFVSIDDGIVTSTDDAPAVTDNTPVDNAWYTLTGIRLDSRPAQPGAYIHNHRVQIIR